MNRYHPPHLSYPMVSATYPASHTPFNSGALSYHPSNYQNYAPPQSNYNPAPFQTNTYRSYTSTGGNSQPLGRPRTPYSAYQVPRRNQNTYATPTSHSNAQRPHSVFDGNSQTLNQIESEPNEKCYNQIPPSERPSTSPRLLPSNNSSPSSSRGAYTPSTSSISTSLGPVPRPIFNGVSKAPPKMNPYKRVAGKSYKNIWLRDKIKLKVTAGTADEIKFAFVEPHDYDTVRYTIAMPSFLCSKTEYQIGSELEAMVWTMKIRSGQFTRRINMTDCFDQVQLFEGDELPLEYKNHPGYSFRAVVKTHDTANHEIQVDYFGMRKILLNAPQCHYSLIGNWLNIRTVEVQPGEIQWVAEDFPGFEHLYKK